MRVTSAKKLRMSPTRTGCLKMNWFTATVAWRPCVYRAGITAPARSTCAMTQPPKMSPLPLVSAGMGMTLSTSSLSGFSQDRCHPRWWARKSPEALRLPGFS